jgi:hypothetical protein
VFPTEYKRALGEMAARKAAAAEAARSRHDIGQASGRGQAELPHTRTTKDTIMGKVTGFMEFERLEEGYKPVPSA